MTQCGILFPTMSLGCPHADRDQLLKKAVSLLNVEEAPIAAALEEMLNSEDLKVDGEAIYENVFF